MKQFSSSPRTLVMTGALTALDSKDTVQSHSSSPPTAAGEALTRLHSPSRQTLATAPNTCDQTAVTSRDAVLRLRRVSTVTRRRAGRRRSAAVPRPAQEGRSKPRLASS